jgi:hypothetical protein
MDIATTVIPSSLNGHMYGEIQLLGVLLKREGGDFVIGTGALTGREKGQIEQRCTNVDDDESCTCDFNQYAIDLNHGRFVQNVGNGF